MGLFDPGMEEAGVLEELTGKFHDWVGQNLDGERTDPIFAGASAGTSYLGETRAR